jgi:hypothetical protein
MTFARWIFRISGIYGIIFLAPMYLLEEKVGRDTPPAITHPEFYYGTIGVALAWQVAFLVISHDPRRFRPLMPVATLEKLGYGIPAVVLFLQNRSYPIVLTTAVIDLCLGGLFLAAYQRTRLETPTITPAS